MPRMPYTSTELYTCTKTFAFNKHISIYMSTCKIQGHSAHSNLISFMRLYVDKVYASHQPGYLRDITQLALNMAPDNPTFVSDMHLSPFA